MRDNFTVSVGPVLTAYSLMPLLQKAKDAGEDAKMLTVLSAGLESGPIDLDDLGLKKNFSLPNAARSMSTYNDLMVQVSLHPPPTIQILIMGTSSHSQTNTPPWRSRTSRRASCARAS